VGWPVVAALRAADYGQMGQTFPIIETDLLTTIETRLKTLEANGGIERMQRQMQEQAVASVRRPKPVDGMTPATAGANGCSIPRSSPRTTSSMPKAT
jgi:conjugal transfer pilus assembly protein TraW